MEKLQTAHAIVESVNFPNGIFEYRLMIVAEPAAIVAGIKNQSIEVRIPAGIAAKWMNTAQTGIYQTIETPEGQPLDVIIEKDFPCKEDMLEDKNDFFTPDTIPIPPNQC